MPKKTTALVALAAALTLAGCGSDADVVSENLSKDSDNFKIDRRVVFFTIEGRCSIAPDVEVR